MCILINEAKALPGENMPNMVVGNSIIDLIGKTPLIRLRKVIPEDIKTLASENFTSKKNF